MLNEITWKDYGKVGHKAIFSDDSEGDFLWLYNDTTGKIITNTRTDKAHAQIWKINVGRDWVGRYDKQKNTVTIRAPLRKWNGEYELPPMLKRKLKQIFGRQIKFYFFPPTGDPMQIENNFRRTQNILEGKEPTGMNTVVRDLLKGTVRSNIISTSEYDEILKAWNAYDGQFEDFVDEKLHELVSNSQYKRMINKMFR